MGAVILCRDDCPTRHGLFTADSLIADLLAFQRGKVRGVDVVLESLIRHAAFIVCLFGNRFAEVVHGFHFFEVVWVRALG